MTKRCPHCSEIKSLSEFYKHKGKPDGHASWCRECMLEARRLRRLRNPERYRQIANDFNHRHGITKPLGTNPKCSLFLGVYIAERVLSHVFEHVDRMPNNNPGFDFICKRGHKIDVKSTTRRKNRPNMWSFTIGKNTIADYFLLLAFDNRESLNPEHVWLLPQHFISGNTSATISERTLEKWAIYELDDALIKVVACCDTLKREAVNEYGI